MAGSCDSGKTAVLENEEFQEEDVWNVVIETDKVDNKEPAPPASSDSACLVSPTTPVGIPEVKSGCLESHQEVAAVPRQSSSPVNIPDWDKIYQRKSNSGVNANQRDGAESFRGFLGNAAAAADDDEDSEEMVPPHEIIARRIARSRIVAFSMCEGIGRTLKGRDLRMVRNTILTLTGFIE